VVGIGDMSGDVFGNGLLLSEHTRLVAAFDHRDIFIDPDPDPAASFAERRGCSNLPRSSWAGLRPGADLRGRWRVPAVGQVDRDQPAGRRPLGIEERVTS
jgi:glutamate dehydrogenase